MDSISFNVKILSMSLIKSRLDTSNLLSTSQKPPPTPWNSVRLNILTNDKRIENNKIKIKFVMVYLNSPESGLL